MQQEEKNLHSTLKEVVEAANKASNGVKADTNTVLEILNRVRTELHNSHMRTFDSHNRLW